MSPIWMKTTTFVYPPPATSTTTNKNQGKSKQLVLNLKWKSKQRLPLLNLVEMAEEFKCIHCSDVFEDKNKLKYHVQKEHRVKVEVKHLGSGKKTVFICV